MAFVADVIKNMYRHMVHWYICMFIDIDHIEKCFVDFQQSERVFFMFLAHLN